MGDEGDQMREEDMARRSVGGWLGRQFGVADMPVDRDEVTNVICLRQIRFFSFPIYDEFVRR